MINYIANTTFLISNKFFKKAKLLKMQCKFYAIIKIILTKILQTNKMIKVIFRTSLAKIKQFYS
jgi:hypothetical protein